MNETIYLDYNATSPVSAEVFDAMMPYFGRIFGNPSSPHRYGREAAEAVNHARTRVAALLQAKPEEVVFTPGGTMSNNLALAGAAALAPKDRHHLIVSSIEHSSVLQCCRELIRSGWTISEVPVDHLGHVRLDRLEELIRPETYLISVMLANNETGAVQPIREIARVAAENGLLMHTDAIQAAGKLEIDVNALGVDLLSLSAHKFGGPKGIGALFVRSGLTLQPRSFGGGQEKGLNPGTENVSGIVGLGKAAELARIHLDDHITAMQRLFAGLERQLKAQFPEAVINTPPDHRLPNTLSVSFPGIPNAALVARLDARGIAVSTGAACGSAHPDKPSHVLQAAGRSAADAMTAIRISFGPNTPEEHLRQLVAAIHEIVRQELNPHRH